MRGWRFGALQIGMRVATLLPLLSLVSVIPLGLLGRPVHPVGGDSSGALGLQWFVDRSPSDVPQLAAWSLPLWLDQLAMLAWALCLANALIGWLRWG
jgi:hypothetical protein